MTIKHKYSQLTSCLQDERRTNIKTWIYQYNLFTVQYIDKTKKIGNCKGTIDIISNDIYRFTTVPFKP